MLTDHDTSGLARTLKESTGRFTWHSGMTVLDRSGLVSSGRGDKTGGLPPRRRFARLQATTAKFCFCERTEQTACQG